MGGEGGEGGPAAALAQHTVDNERSEGVLHVRATSQACILLVAGLSQGCSIAE